MPHARFPSVFRRLLREKLGKDETSVREELGKFANRVMMEKEGLGQEVGGMDKGRHDARSHETTRIIQ
jgi:hypothetical protein